MSDLAEFYRNKRVLVTGHTGFIGSWLTKWLEMMNAEICGCSLDPPTKPNMYGVLNLKRKITDLRIDVRHRDPLRKAIFEFQPEIVFHLAAQPLVLESFDNPVDTFEVNVIGTVNILDCLRNTDKLKSIVVVTSDKAYRNEEWVYPYRETDSLGGKDPYSASKSCQDITVTSFRDSYFSDAGVGISSVRAGNVIGGGDWAKDRIVPDLVRSIVKGGTASLRNPDSIRPWQHVLEPVRGMLMLAERMWGNASYSGDWNFGPDNRHRISVKGLSDKFIKYWGNGSYKIQNERCVKESNYLQLDISKVEQKLGWAPIYDIDISVRKTVEWYKRYYSDKHHSEKMTAEQITSYYNSWTELQ